MTRRRVVHHDEAQWAQRCERARSMPSDGRARRGRHALSAVVALLVTLPQSAAAHGPAPGDLRPQWLIDAMGAIDRWREQRHANQFFGTLYGKRAETLEPLLAPGGACGASSLTWAFREMTARNTADGVVFEARSGFDIFFGMESSTIARSAMEAWSWDACARGAPRRMEWRGRDGGPRVAVDANGVAEVVGADGLTQRTSDPDLGLVLGFPCQSDSDCVLLRESCDPGRQRSAFAKRAPYFDAWRAALERGLKTHGACTFAEAPPYDRMVAVCREAQCDVQIPR